MIDPATEELTMRRVLLKGDHDLRTAAEETGAMGAIDERLTPVPPGLRTAARDQILALIVDALDQRLVDVIVMGWKGWDRLVDKARGTLEAPTASDVVELLDHEVTSTHRPRIEVEFGGEKIAEIAVDLDATILLHAVTAVLARGRLVAIRSGRAEVSAELAVQGITVMRAARALELPIEIPLGDGIVLA
ncbi:MAG TPA: hypothetical protein VF129_14010, partial [Actinomycetota bacterium]